MAQEQRQASRNCSTKGARLKVLQLLAATDEYIGFCILKATFKPFFLCFMC